MKKVFSVLILLILLFLVFEFGFNYFKSGHETNYQVFFEKVVFNIKEVYEKENGDVYNIEINDGNNTFYYTINNIYNKQKKIISKIEYFNENDNSCIYPILENGEGTYLECIKNNKIYTASSFPDTNFINKISNNLIEKGFSISKNIDTTTTKKHGNSTVYENNLLDSHIITLWTYKGIHTFTLGNYDSISLISFDKYENNHGYLVGKYYVFPSYLSNKVLEFSQVSIVDLDNMENLEYLDLGYTLSSSTYVNGVIGNKIYYTDPSNLIQLEVNLDNKNVRLIGNKEIGGQMYNGSWTDRNIYDFVNSKILFTEKMPNFSKYSYRQIKEGNSSYYFYNNDGEVYQIPKSNLDTSILLFKASGMNNFNVVGDTIYYVVNDTLYYYSVSDGNVPIVKNNELKYNTTNRISVYRKS